MKRRIFVALICILLLLASCAEEVTYAESTTADTTEAPKSVSLAGYTVVRPQSASDEIVQAAAQLRLDLLKLTEDVSISDDWINPTKPLPDAAPEILVGMTNRAETAEASAELLSDDFIIKYFPESGRIVVCGGSDKATLRAIDYFLAYCQNSGEIEDSLFYLSKKQYEVSECLILGEAIENYTLVLPGNATADEEYAAELIAAYVLEKTGKTVSLSAEASGKQIRIGRAADAEFGNGEYTYGAKNGNIVISGDGGLVVRAAREFLRELFAEGGEKISYTPENVKTLKFESTSYPALPDFGAKPIALTEESILVYDISSDTPALKYEFKPSVYNGFTLKSYNGRMDEARLRYSEKLGSYVIGFTSSSGYAAIAEYPSEKCIWETMIAASSPHSIEYLPCGMVAVASSAGGKDDGFVRLYSTDAGKDDDRYDEEGLTSAHALLWDEVREVLWAMGSTEIAAYEIGEDTSAPSLMKTGAYGCSNMKGGHDLSALYGSDDKLLVGGGIVRIFDKTTGKLISDYDGSGIIDSDRVKCICSFPDGDFALTVATAVQKDHWTDRFRLFSFDGGKVSEKTYAFDGIAFYKARSFIADYN